MKKLKLKALNLGASEVLTREQLKNIMGGDGSGGGSGGPGSCSDGCGPTVACPVNSPYCRDSECTDSSGVTHYVTACSPTQS